MKKTISAIIACTILFASAVENPSHNVGDSANTTKSETGDKKHLQVAHELLESMNMKAVYNKMLVKMTDNLVTKIPALKNSKEKILEFYRKYIGWDAIKDDQAKIYKKYFSIKEMEDLKNFYKTETGKKTLSLMPEIMTEGQVLAQKKIVPHMDELKKIMAESLKKFQEKSSSGVSEKGAKK